MSAWYENMAFSLEHAGQKRQGEGIQHPGASGRLSKLAFEYTAAYVSQKETVPGGQRQPGGGLVRAIVRDRGSVLNGLNPSLTWMPN